MKGRIKPGTQVGQDFNFLRWPEDQNIIFDIEDVGSNLKRCTAPGFGKRGDYGNGAVYVYDPDGIEPILEPDDMTLELLWRKAKERDRLLVLAIKHCTRDHHDWQEILRFAEAQTEEV